VNLHVMYVIKWNYQLLVVQAHASGQFRLTKTYVGIAARF
jgi:hypothetical protein